MRCAERAARRVHWRRPALLLALFLIPSSLLAQGELVRELQSVHSVKLEGRRSIPARDLWAIMKTRRPSRLPWAQRPVLRRDFLESDARAIENVYRQYGYLDARVEWRTEPRGGGVRVVFKVEEGRRSRIRAIELVGVHVFEDRDLLRRLHARPGRPFNPSYLIADTTRISDAYQERGYLPHVRAGFRRDSLTVKVIYEVEEGPLFRFGEVYFSSPGEAQVRENLVRRELLVREGEVFRASRVQRSVERLYETGLFRQVQMIPLPDSSNRVIEFDLRVRERKPRWVDAGIGSGTEERFRLTGEWGHRNMARQGLQGVLAGRLALDGQGRFLLGRAQASMLEPWVAGTRTRGLATLYYESRFDRANPDWVVRQQARGLTFQLRREVNRTTRVAITQDNAFVTQELSFDRDVDRARRDSLNAIVEPSYSTHRIQLVGDRDTRDDFLRTQRGSVQNLIGEVAGGPLSGTSSFTKWEAAASWFTPFRGRWVVAARLHAGVINPFGTPRRFSPDSLDAEVARVPLEDRFRIGGVNSLRGFNENEVPNEGGLAVIQGNLEVRVPVSGPFGLEFFLDAGNAWPRPAYIKLEHFLPKVSDEPLDPGDVRYTFGVGARVDLPFGPLRLDFSWSLRPDENDVWRVARPQFALGPSF